MVQKCGSQAVGARSVIQRDQGIPERSVPSLILYVRLLTFSMWCWPHGHHMRLTVDRDDGHVVVINIEAKTPVAGRVLDAESIGVAWARHRRLMGLNKLNYP